MTIEEIEVYVTQDGLGRAAIVRRPDGFYCIYSHWLPPQRLFEIGFLAPGGPRNWHSDKVDTSLLYENKEPENGIYGRLEDARREILKRDEFCDRDVEN